MRVPFGVEKALRIYGENSDTNVDILFGSAAPGGDTGPQDDAAIGSVYIRTNGSLYQKIADANEAADWALNTASGMDWSVPIDSNITVDTHDTYSLGTASAALATIYAGSGGFVTDDGAGINTSVYQGGMGHINSTSQAWFELYENEDPDGATNIHAKLYSDGGGNPSLDIFSTNKLWLRAEGNVAMYAGNASTFRFQKTGVSNTVGDVWTATGTDGTGYWAPGFDPNASPVEFLNAYIELRDDANDWWTGSNTKIQNGNDMVDSYLVVGTHDLLVGGDVKKGLALLTGSQDGGPNGGTGQMDVLTGYVWSGTGNSGNFFWRTGDIGGGVTGNSGQIDFNTGGNGGTGNSGAIIIGTGSAAAGNSGNLTVQTGTASGTRGYFQVDADTIRLKDAATGAASIGNVFTLQDPATGRGTWSAAANLLDASFRSDKVIAATGDAAPANDTVIDLVADPFTDDEGTTLVAADFLVGDRILFGVGGTPKLMRVSVVSGDEITVTDVTVDPLAANDVVVVQNYLPDSPADQEAAALAFYDGTNIIKISDFNWALANGITLNGYTESQGPIAGSDSVQVAIEKSGGDITDMVALSGVARGEVDLGAFSGATIPDDQTVKQAFQALETAHEEVDVNVNDLIALSGVAENEQDLGTFTGATIPDDQTIKQALQALETAHEEVDVNVNDLITLSGVAENEQDLGAFSGATIPDDQTIKQALQSVETALEARSQQTGVTTAATLDSVLVDDIKMVKWLVHVFEEAAPERIRAMEVIATHNGTAAADATAADNSLSGILQLGTAFNLTVSVDLNGAGGAQVMRLRVASTSAGVTATARRIQVY